MKEVFVSFNNYLILIHSLLPSAWRQLCIAGALELCSLCGKRQSCTWVFGTAVGVEEVAGEDMRGTNGRGERTNKGTNDEGETGHSNAQRASCASLEFRK